MNPRSGRANSPPDLCDRSLCGIMILEEETGNGPICLKLNPMIYLDNNSTTRVDPRVVAAMIPYFETFYGNAASTSHSMGWEAAGAVENAVESMARCIGAEARELVITSGATESINLAIKGVAPYLEKRGRHVISSLAEHKAGIDPIKRLVKQGWSVTWLKPDSTGMIAPEQVAEAVTDQTSLVSIILANNETGTISPIRDIAEVCHRQGITLHTDATQAIGKIPVDVDDLEVDLMSFTAHKFYGPKGIGGLYVRRRDRPVRLVPLIEGGGHQRGLRSGTLPVPLIVGMATAMEIAINHIPTETVRLVELRDLLESLIMAEQEGVTLNGHRVERISNTLNLSFSGVSGEALMLTMKEIAVSSGSACSAADPEPSHVLKAIGLTDDAARSSLRFSLGRFNTEDEIRTAARCVIESVTGLLRLNTALRN
jgi:cysteine desulfurase